VSANHGKFAAEALCSHLNHHRRSSPRALHLAGGRRRIRRHGAPGTARRFPGALAYGGILLSWNGHYAAMAVPQPQGQGDPINRVEATVKLMPLVGNGTGWEKPMGDISFNANGGGHFDPDNQRFELYNRAWTLDGKEIDYRQVNWDHSAKDPLEGSVKTPDGTTAVVDTLRDTIVIVQADGRRSTHQLGLRKKAFDLWPYMRLSPDGRAQIVRDMVKQEREGRHSPGLGHDDRRTTHQCSRPGTWVGGSLVRR
jgi:hypothetical protein